MSAPSRGADVPIWAPYYGATILIAFKRFWRKYVVFTGRASRSEYWWWALVNVVIYIVLQIIASATGETSTTATATGTQASFSFADQGVVGVIIGLSTLATIPPETTLHGSFEESHVHSPGRPERRNTRAWFPRAGKTPIWGLPGA